MLNNLLSFLGPEYHGYVVKLTDVKMSPGKVKYFNAVMHNGHDELNIVSYNERLHGTMEAARLKDKPLKFEQFYEHHDEFKNQKVLKLHEGTAV